MNDENPSFATELLWETSTRRGLTFKQVFELSVETPGFLDEFHRLCPVKFHREAKTPIERLVDDACIPPKERAANLERMTHYLIAYVYLFAWRTFEPLPEENTALLDTFLEWTGRRNAPELFT